MRVFAYITRETPQGEQFLAFAQDDPVAGLQVPGGGVDPGETLVEALWREIREESGLESLELRREVASGQVRNPDDGLPERHHAFHLEGSDLPETWSHTVTHGADDAGLVFHYRWLPVDPDVAREVRGTPEWIRRRRF
jgi:ADP-ribose pyrophosphatase YjhB (NUDIX family)